MRSSILLLCAIFFGLHTAFAQAQFNLKAGVNLTQANAEYEEGNIDGDTPEFKDNIAYLLVGLLF